jgi:hypothetical protein
MMHSTKSWSNHSIVPLEVAQFPSRCALHNNEPLKYFCTNSACNTMICGDCKIIGRHSHHDCVLALEGFSTLSKLVPEDALHIDELLVKLALEEKCFSESIEVEDQVSLTPMFFF